LSKIVLTKSDRCHWLADNDIDVFLNAISLYYNLDVNKIVFLNSLHSVLVKSGMTDILNDFNPRTLRNKKYVFSIVSNCQDKNLYGSHWSLLVYERTTNTFYHYDSIENCNNQHAKLLACNLFNLIHKNKHLEFDFHEMDCPQQTNSYDCGPYMLHMSQSIIHQLTTSHKSQTTNLLQHPPLTPPDPLLARKFIKLLTKETHQQKQQPSTGKKKAGRVLLKTARGRVHLFGDSQARGVGTLIDNCNCHITSSVKPGGKFDNVVDNVPSLTSSFNKHDFVFVMAGTNDISYSGDLHFYQHTLHKGLTSLLSTAKKTNVFICSIPYRYDKPFLNSKITEANNFLVKTIHNFTLTDNDLNLKYLNVNLSRHDMTSHGLHLNASGKSKVGKVLTSVTKQKTKTKLDITLDHWVVRTKRDSGLVSSPVASNCRPSYCNKSFL
jgi:sentrin-specific protease 8